MRTIVGLFMLTCTLSLGVYAFHENSFPSHNQSVENPYASLYEKSISNMQAPDQSLDMVFPIENFEEDWRLAISTDGMPIIAASKTCSKRCSTTCSKSCTTTRGCSRLCKSYTEGCGGTMSPSRDYSSPVLPSQQLAPTSQIPMIPSKDFTGMTAYEVVRVIDGDTVVLLMEGKATTVRLIGVDTPETVHPQKTVEHYGKEASRFTENLLKGESVYVEHEAGTSQLDKYGRELVYLYRAPDGLFVNLEIVRQGYAHAHTLNPFQHIELFRYYEQRARDAQKGLWNKTNPAIPESK